MIIHLPDFDNTPSLQDGEFTKLPAGGYVCVITGADVTTAKTGTKQLVLTPEISEGEFAGYFKNAKFVPPYYKSIYTKDGKTSPYFKGLLKNFETSNSNFKATATLDVYSLVGKKIGLVFRDEEREYNGNIYTDAKPIIATSVEKIRNGDFKIPPIKKLERKAETAADNQTGTPAKFDDSNFPF